MAGKTNFVDTLRKFWDPLAKRWGEQNSQKNAPDELILYEKSLEELIYTKT